MSIKKTICTVLAAILGFACVSCGEQTENPPEQPASREDFAFTQSQFGGTDALGRTMTASAGDNGKYVGVFFNVNNSETGGMNQIYDIAKLLEQYGSYNDWRASGKTLTEYLETNPVLSRIESVSSGISPNGKFHWYGEPLYGYYSNCDSWVLKKQLELLGLIGVDYLLLDLSNHPFMFTESMHAILTAIAEMQAAGNVVPKAAIMFSVGAPYSLEMLQNAMGSFINEKKYEDVWFRGNQKMNPAGGALMVGNWDVTDPDEFPKCWLKQMQWPTEDYDDDALSWMDWADKQHNHNGTMNVSVAQHLTGTWSSKAYVYPERGDLYHGRGWTYGDPTTGYVEEKVMSGANFQQQWDWAIQNRNALDLVLVTGWNEWAVRKLGVNETSAEFPKFKYAPFVDEFSLAYSREIEMMMGGYGDNFTFQLAMNIRKFKETAASTAENVVTNQKKTIELGKLAGWEGSNLYRDAVGEVMERNAWTGERAIHYTDTSNRNDIASVQLANDGTYLFAKVTCVSDIEAYVSGDNWMNLYLKSGKNTNGWADFDFLVNAAPGADGKTSVSRLTSGADGKKVLTDAGSADYFLSGKNIVFRIKLSDLGVSGNDVVGVKAADNVAGEGSFRVLGTAEDFYLTGDSAPTGRFYYNYRIA